MGEWGRKQEKDWEKWVKSMTKSNRNSEQGNEKEMDERTGHYRELSCAGKFGFSARFKNTPKREKNVAKEFTRNVF